MSQQKYPKVFIITPIHNAKDHTLRFLNSLQKVIYPNFKIVIVDDGSTDYSSEAIKKKFPGVIVLQGDGNLWWSGGNNVGIKESLKRGADYVLTINNDVEVEPEFLSHLVQCALENPNSIIGGKILYISEKNRIWQFGTFYNPFLGLKIYGGNKIDTTQYNERKNVDALTGMCVLIPAKVFNDIGFYDERNFPMIYGDSDFTLRAKANGYNIIVEPKARIYTDALHSGLREEKNPLKYLWFGLFSHRGGREFLPTLKFHWRYSKFLCIFPLVYIYFIFLCAFFGRLFLGKNRARRVKKHFIVR